MTVLNRLSVVAVLAVAGSVVGAAKATTLADIGTVSIAGITYSNFTWSSATVPASDVTVTELGNGFRFSFTNDDFNSSGLPIDGVIQYDAMAATPIIADVRLGMSGVGTDGGVASVAEGVTGDATGNLSTVESDSLPSNTTDQLTFDAPVASLHLLKDIQASGTMSGGTADVYTVDNEFDQTGALPPVPEPMSLALLPLALVGLGLRKKLAH